MSAVDRNNQAIMVRKQTTMIEKPLMRLKDYLLDDLSSCSSNGFKSFPRKRQCCTTVRLLLEIDLKQNKDHSNRVLRRSRSKTASAKLSVLLRASDAVINAVKHLPYRRLLMSRFWGKSNGCKERKRLDRFGPSDQNTESAMSGDKSDKSAVSWWESEFGNSEEFLRSFSSSGQCSTESCSVENDVVVRNENDVSLGKANKQVDTAKVGDDSSTEAEMTTVKEWSNEEEKEQFSPVSILDCPFDDDDNDDQTTSPNFHHKLVSLEGTKQKIRRFENLAHIEPVDLEKRIAMSELEEKKLSATISIQKGSDLDKRNKIEEKARVLMKLIKRKNGYLGSKADNLMFDFFNEMVIEDINENKMVNVKEALKVMEDWVSNGEKREVWLGWEVKEGRNAYVKDMEKGGKWKRFEVEKEEVGLDLEANIWESLVLELFD